MEHICIGCGYKEINDKATSPSTCKKCGEQMLHRWDEQSDYESEMKKEIEDSTERC
jgi:predicted  nucleic acid-binding Zn-ribbon protein